MSNDVKVAIWAFFGAIIGAGIASGATVWTTLINNEAALELERQKAAFQEVLSERELEASIVLKIVETENVETAKQNLLFVLDAGLIRDSEGLIREAVEADTVPLIVNTYDH